MHFNFAPWLPLCGYTSCAHPSALHKAQNSFASSAAFPFLKSLLLYLLCVEAIKQESGIKGAQGWCQGWALYKRGGHGGRCHTLMILS